MPTLPVERLDLALGRLARTQQRAHEQHVAGQDFPNSQRVWRFIVLCRRHPRWPYGGLAQLDNVVALPETTAATKVGATSPRTMLLEHGVDTTALEFSEEKIRGEQRVAQQYITGLQVIEQRTKQALLIGALALSWTRGRIDDGIQR